MSIRTRLLKSRLLRECREYSYRRWADEDEIRSLLAHPPAHFSERTAAELIAGCVRLTAVLYEIGGRVCLGFDFYVKDSPGSAEWILFENLCGAGDTKESTMLNILDEAVTAHGLSYTECSFAKLDGTQVNLERK